jgi:Na+-transporting NADH:ubiquinone oxidoreductase subunit NqrB
MENIIVSAQQQNQTAQSTRLGAPLAVVPGITGNVLTVVSFLIGTSSFILGLRIQNATNPSSITRYFEFLILALVIPAIIINIFGILLVGGHLYPSDFP